MLVEKWIAFAFEMYILILVVVGLRQISYELFIASYYGIIDSFPRIVEGKIM